MIVACTDNKGVNEILSGSKTKIISYGAKNDPVYMYKNVRQSKDGISFDIKKGALSYTIHSPMIGAFNAENITACFAMASEIGIPSEKIIQTIADFKGIKRRFEKRHEGSVTVYDCHAPTAEKAQSVLQTLREIYPGKIVAIFEPNIGGRSKESVNKYDGAFSTADTVIIPRLSKLKVAEDKTSAPLEGDELTALISKTHPHAIYIEDDALVIESIARETTAGEVIVFLGSHGFRGMIEEVVKKFT